MSFYRSESFELSRWIFHSARASIENTKILDTMEVMDAEVPARTPLTSIAHVDDIVHLKLTVFHDTLFCVPVQSKIMPMLSYIVECTINSQALFGDRHERICSSEHPYFRRIRQRSLQLWTTCTYCWTWWYQRISITVRVDCILQPSANRLQQASLSTQKHWRRRSYWAHRH